MKKKCVRISTVFRHCVRAFLLCSSTFCVHFYYFPALFSVRISTVFRHWVRAFLLPSQHFMRAFLLHSIAFGLLWTASGLLGFKRTLWEVRCITNHRISSAIYFYRISIAIYFYCISISISEMPPDFKTSWRDLYDEICSIGPNIERIISIFSLWDPCAS